MLLPTAGRAGLPRSSPTMSIVDPWPVSDSSGSAGRVRRRCRPATPTLKYPSPSPPGDGRASGGTLESGAVEDRAPVTKPEIITAGPTRRCRALLAIAAPGTVSRELGNGQCLGIDRPGARRAGPLFHGLLVHIDVNVTVSLHRRSRPLSAPIDAPSAPISAHRTRATEQRASNGCGFNAVERRAVRAKTRWTADPVGNRGGGNGGGEHASRPSGRRTDGMIFGRWTRRRTRTRRSPPRPRASSPR